MSGLALYNDIPFNSADKVDQIDTATGDGVTTAFTVVNKAGTQVGGTVTANATQYYRFNGGFTVSGSVVTLISAPPVNANVVIPGVSAIIASAFDQASVTGVPSNANIEQFYFFLADVSTIATTQYTAMPSQAGIAISFVNLTSGYGPDLTWVQLACADANGNALTFQATGTTLYTDSYSAYSTLASSISTGASSLVINGASGGTFYAGDYIDINAGNGTEEIVKILAINGNTLTITPTTFSHSAAEIVYMCARKFWGKLTVPINATSGQAFNFYNIVPQVLCKVLSRL